MKLTLITFFVFSITVVADEKPSPNQVDPATYRQAMEKFNQRAAEKQKEAEEASQKGPSETDKLKAEIAKLKAEIASLKSQLASSSELLSGLKDQIKIKKGMTVEQLKAIYGSPESVDRSANGSVISATWTWRVARQSPVRGGAIVGPSNMATDVIGDPYHLYDVTKTLFVHFNGGEAEDWISK